MRVFRILFLTAFLLQSFLPASQVFAQSSTPLADLGNERLKSCFGLLPEQATSVLGEEVDPIPTIDDVYGYCTYASVSEQSVSPSDDLLPTYGPASAHLYLAATVWPVGNFTDPWMYLAYALLDRDQSKLNDFMGKYDTTDMEALVNAESSRDDVSREFLSMLGSGALWYWQETSSGHHLAGIYAVNGEQRIAVQALVAPDRTAEDVQAGLISTVAQLIEDNSPQIGTLRIAPVFMDSCPNFSPYDAAAILQEPVNGDAPVGNLVFGPLTVEYEEMLRGMCGYTNNLAATSGDATQTQLATDLPYGHAVAVARFTGEIQYSTNGTMQMDWMELIALAEVVAAANPNNDGKIFDYLYGTFNVGDFASWTYALEELAKGSPSFKVTRLTLAADDRRDELLWLWQTLDDGHFSLLVSRQGDDFDLVAALLGSRVNEKVVQGYSSVLLEKIAAPVEVAAQGGDLCAMVSAEDASAIVGETVQGTLVESAQGTGCKYTPSTDDARTRATDFSPFFQTFGLLAGTVPPKAAQKLLSGFVEELSTTGIVQDGDALQAVLDALQAQDFATALQQMGELEWNSTTWQVETVTELSESALLITGKSGNGWNQFHLLSSLASGDVVYLSGVLRNEVAAMREQIVTAAQQFAQTPFSAGAKETPLTSEDVECPILSLAEAASILGDTLRVQSAEGDRGVGCKFTPASEEDGETVVDFAPDFATQGILAGMMSDEGAKTSLSELADMAGADDRRLTRAFSRNDIATALSRLAILAPESDEWKIEPLPEVGTSAIWVHTVWEGSLMAIFFNNKGKDQTQTIIVQIPADSDVEAMRTAVVVALTR